MTPPLRNTEFSMPKPNVDKVKDISLFTDGAANLPDGRLAMLYVVLCALENKDKLAIELLDAAGYVMYDTNGNIIYPPQPKDEPPQGNGNG